MEQKLDKLMGIYSEALDELMGAQKYAKCAHKAEDAQAKTMYHGMAKQELEHAHLLTESGHRVAAGDATLTMIWEHLKKHLMDWRGDIEYKLNK